MAADNWKRYDQFPEFLGDGGIDMDDDTFICNLYLSTSNAATLSTTAKASVTNQVATGNGYTQDTETIVSPTWVSSSGTVTFDSADPAWTASGGSIVARFAVIYDDTATLPSADLLIAVSLLDNAPADVTVTDGNTLTIQINASGILTLSGGQS